MSNYYQLTDFIRDGESEYYFTYYFQTKMTADCIQSDDWQRYYLEWNYGDIKLIDDDYWSWNRIVAVSTRKPVSDEDIKVIEKYHTVSDLDKSIKIGKQIQENNNG